MLTPEAIQELEGLSEYEEFKAFTQKTGVVKSACMCTFHRERCDLMRALLHLAGIICVSWSPMGNQLGTDGVDYKTFVAWVCVRRKLQDGILVTMSKVN